ncbi:unnamed protein product [Notodromas monacha]|uniref:Superoxide dismutase n=1 Tax=Notodromas monacha TaxID=399045 RepID=A0A7R9GJW2_9CRUS|nr:unnamed protein product [Notodromas monacha]CAG0923230.1 unnamed protein product [Notodromas monacha]
MTGLIRGLRAEQIINFQVRRFGDVSNNCAKQGVVYNPNQMHTGGFLILETEAGEEGILSLNHSAPSVRASLWGPGRLSIINRSLRIATGAENATGTILACGFITEVAPIANTINAASAPGVIPEK